MNPSQSKSGIREAPFMRAVFIATAVFFALHLIASFVDTARFWGFHHWRFFPISIRLLLCVGLLMCIPKVNRVIVRHAEPLFSNIASKFFSIHKILSATVLSLFFFVIFWCFRNRTHFLGDGYILIRSVTKGNQLIWAEPFDSYFHFFVYRILKNSFGWNAETSYAFVSCFFGACFVFGAVLFSRVMAKDASKKFFLLFSLLSMGSVQLFFGYVESYTILIFEIFVFIFVSLLYLQNKCSLFFSSFVLSLTMCTHTSAVILLPSLVYLYLCKAKGWRFSQHNVSLFLKMVLGFMIPILLFLFLIDQLGFSVTVFLREITRESHIVPLIHAGDGSESFRYGLLSFTHVLNIVNEFILIAPLGLLLGLWTFLYVRGKNETKDQVAVFLALLSVLCVLYIVLLKPDKGASRDWDLFAMCSIPWTLFGVYVFIHRSIHKETFLRIGLVLVCAGFLHTVPWIVINADTERSVERFRLLSEKDMSWSSVALADAFDEFAVYFRHAGMEEERIEYSRKAAEALPTSRYRNNLGAAYVENGMYREAISVLTKVDDNTAYAASAHSNMGFAYDELGQPQAAISEYQKAIQIDPQNERAHYNLAHIYLDLNRFQEAIAEFQETVDINPKHGSAYNNMGIAYYNLNQIEKAVSALQKAIEIHPNQPSYHGNLGAAYLIIDKTQEAISELRKALSLDHENIQAHFNLGLVYFNQDRNHEAIPHFQKVLQVNPDHAGAHKALDQLKPRIQGK